MNTLYQQIGRRISLLRKEHHITQALLAEKLNISVKPCSEVERGLSCLSLEKLIDLCSILSTDLDFLVRGVKKDSIAEIEVPSYITKLFCTEDKEQRELLQEYILFFKRIMEFKE